MAMRIAGHPAVPAMPETVFDMNSIQDRSFLWSRTLRMAADHPLRGIGPGQWKLRLPQYGSIDRQVASDGNAYEVVFTRPHNDFLWVLAETGFPGLICLLLFFGILIRRCIRLLRAPGSEPVKRLAACMLFGIVGFMVISCLSFPRERIFHNVFLSLIAAVIVTLDHASPKVAASRIRPAARWPLFLGTGTCVICLLVGGSRYRSDLFFNRALKAMNAGSTQAAVRLIDQARTGLYTLGPATVPLKWYAGMMHYRSGRMDRAIDDFVRATVDHPFHLHSLNNAAVCIAMAGNGPAAGHFRQRADRIDAVRIRR
jgi:hypothetical protein